MPIEVKGGHGKLPRDLRDKRNVNPYFLRPQCACVGVITIRGAAARERAQKKLAQTLLCSAITVDPVDKSALALALGPASGQHGRSLRSKVGQLLIQRRG